MPPGDPRRDPRSAPHAERSDAGDGTRDFGRDGISGLLSPDRAMRGRDVSRPGPEDEAEAAAALDDLIARASGRRAR